MPKFLIRSIFIFILYFLIDQSFAFSLVRIDYYLSSQNSPTAIVVGEILEIDVDPQFPRDGTQYFFSGQLQNTFRFKIDQVLWGPQELAAKTLKIKYPTEYNPLFDPVIPYKTGTVCILILGGNQDDFYWLTAVLPALQKNFENLPDLQAAKRFITKTLLDALAKAKSPEEQLQLVRSVGPLLTAKEAEALIPFVDSPDVSLRRAAVAGLLHATKDPKYLSIVLKDVEDYLSNATYEINGMESPGDDYFIGDEGYENNATLLPIFRLIAKCKNPKMSEYFRGDVLLSLGVPDNTQDLPLVYSFYMDIRNQRPELLKDRSADYDSFRLRSLKAMATILKLPFDDTIFYNNIESIPREKGYEEEMYKLIREEIVKRGLMSQDAFAAADSSQAIKSKTYHDPLSDGMTVSVRPLGEHFKFGDDISIEFEVHNGSTTAHKYYIDQSINLTGSFDLVVKNEAGEAVSGTWDIPTDFENRKDDTGEVLPGASFKRVFPLNKFADIGEPGHYEITGIYHLEYNTPSVIFSQPITISLEQRTPAEIDKFIKNLSEEYFKSDQGRKAVIVRKFMHTHDPRALPVVIDALYTDRMNFAWPLKDAIKNYFSAEASVDALLKAANDRGLTDDVTEQLRMFKVDRERVFPVIVKSLAPENPQFWAAGANAAIYFPEDQLTPRLIAIAKDAQLDKGIREEAIMALALNRTDESVATLKELLNGPDPEIKKHVQSSIKNSYINNPPGEYSVGRPLKPEDFPDLMKRN